MFPRTSTPLRLFVVASLLLTFIAPVSADDCKPVVDKARVMVEIGVDGSGAQKVALSIPVNTKKDFNGEEQGVDYAHSRPAAGFTYNVHVAERRDDGAMIDLVVNVRAPNGSYRTIKRSVYVAHQRVVEQLFLGGVSLKAYFPMKPFHCKKA